MSTAATWQTESSSSGDTSSLGAKFGRACKGGEVFLLVSDLGGGKTTFTQGLARGLGSVEHVGSPSYTIVRVYKCRDDLYLHHFDFYRLDEGGVVTHDLSEVMQDPQAIVVIEWGDVISDILPDRAVTIRFDRVAGDDQKRSISVSYPAESTHVMKELL